MRGMLCACVLVLCTARVRGRESVPVPWEEFKTLYRERIERRMREALEDEPAPWRYVLERAAYRVRIHARRAEGTVLISGRVLSGEPEVIPLFGADTIIASVESTKAGALLSPRAGEAPIGFLPAGLEPFQVALRLMLPIEEDVRSKLDRKSTRLNSSHYS